MFSSLIETTLAHEIGHNVFANFNGFKDVGGWRYQEWTANYFMRSLGYQLSPGWEPNDGRPNAFNRFIDSFSNNYYYHQYQNFIHKNWGNPK